MLGCFHTCLSEIWANPMYFKNLNQWLGLTIFDPNMGWKNMGDGWNDRQAFSFMPYFFIFKTLIQTKVVYEYNLFDKVDSLQNLIMHYASALLLASSYFLSILDIFVSWKHDSHTTWTSLFFCFKYLNITKVSECVSNRCWVQSDPFRGCSKYCICFNQ